jgi:hypothetical protein
MTDVLGLFPSGKRITAVSRSERCLDLFACDIDGFVRRAWFTDELFLSWGWSSQYPTQREHGWSVTGQTSNQSLFPGGAEVAAVCLEGTGNRIDIFACGLDGQVHTTRWTSQTDWIQWQLLDNEAKKFPPGAYITAISRSSKNLDLFICDSNGEIATAGLGDRPEWSNWESIGAGFPVQIEIAAVSLSESTIDLFACTNSVLKTNKWVENQPINKDWTKVPVGGVGVGDKVVAVKGLMGLHLFFNGNDGFMYACWLEGEEWNWHKIKHQEFPGAIDFTAAVWKEEENIHLFVSHGSTLQQATWWATGNRRQWNNWQRLIVDQ